MHILGISAFYHDSAACLIRDGEIVAAAQEERFSRIKHDEKFPLNAIRYCLKEAGLALSDVSYVTFYEKPFVKFERLLETYLAFAPRGFLSFTKAMPAWIKDKLFQRSTITRSLCEIDPEWKIFGKDRLLFAEHHESHAASAFFPSPFEKAIVLTVDGVGEWATTSVYVGSGNRLELQKEIKFPHSLGLLYAAFTYYAGFKVNSGEYKVMGLAPYGEPKYKDLILRHLIDVKPDGSFALNMEYFDYGTGLKMTSRLFDELFRGKPRQPESELTQREMDLARSIQEVTEEVMVKLVNHLFAEYQIPNLCLAGGVALNCVANGKILKNTPVKNLWIQPAAGDAGGAVGAALATWHEHLKNPRTPAPKDGMKGSYLGIGFRDDEIEAELKRLNAKTRRLGDADFFETVAAALADEKVVGWFQGRMEFGPRALGARSILGDPRSPQMQSVMNLKIKYRESFRPFAPSVLKENVGEYFDFAGESPYMLLVDAVTANQRLNVTDEEKKLFGIAKLAVLRSTIPAVTHVDYSARIQTVDRAVSPRYYDLIAHFYKKTGCPMVINTSFNVRGEPMVCTPADAYRCFMRTEMDVLAIGNFVLYKHEQPVWSEAGDWRKQFVLD